MPRANRLTVPKTDLDWDKLSDEQVEELAGRYPDRQRVTSELEARRERQRVQGLLTGSGDGVRRLERLAVNLFDLDRVLPEIRQMLLAGKLNLKEPVRVDPERMDETGVEFTCPLLSAACICDTLRTHDKSAGDYPTRVYLFRMRAWSRVPGNTPLSVVRDGRVSLNPEVFRVEADLTPPEQKIVVLGGKVDAKGN